MKLTKFLLVALTQIAAVAHQPTAITSEIVVVPSGALRLKALLWLPENGGPFPAVLFNHGSGSSDAMHTGPFVITEAAERLGRVRPETLGQASRIPGITPAAIAVLDVYLSLQQ